MSLGDFDTGSTLYFKFTTFRPSTGAPFTLAGTPAISVYKDASTTQSTAGVTLTVDFDSVTGLNHVAVDTSADGTFYAAGSFFDVVVTTGTVDSVSAVGVVVGRFTLRKTACLKPTTAGRTLDVSSGGEAGIDFANIGSPTTTVNLSGTTISTSQAVASVSGAVGSVTGAVGSVTGNVGGVTGVTFPSVVSSLTAGGVRTELATELGRIDVAVSTRLAGSSYTTPPTAGTIADAVWDETIGDHLTGGSTGAALNAAGSAGDPWTTTLPGSYTGSQAGKILADILVDTGTTLQGEVDDIQSRLPAALVSGRMDASVGAMAANTLTASALATDAVTEIVGGVWNALVASYTTADTFGARLLRSVGAQSEVSVTGSHHVAADIHELQPAVIDSTHFAADAIDSNALAASAVTEVATATLTTAMTESYRAAGVAPTLAQTAFELLAHMGDSAISGTTKTLKKIDGTTAKTFTLDSATTPTSITEAT